MRAQLNQPALPTPALDKMIRQQSSPVLNKTEERFLEWLKAKRRYDRILSQAITLKIGNGVRYTPDFITFDQFYPEDDEDGRSNAYEIEAWEVKGFLRDDAAVKIKVAAHEYPQIKFNLVWWDKETFDWKRQQVYG